MRVIATAAGFYGASRRRVGDEFEFDVEKHGNVPFKKDSDGALVLDDKKQLPVRDTKAPRELPSWLVPASDDARSKLATDKKGAAKREKEAALSAAGPKRKVPGLAGAEDLV